MAVPKPRREAAGGAITSVQALGPQDCGEDSPLTEPPRCFIMTSLAAVTASEATAAKFNVYLFWLLGP